jgi:hypothetical protein
MSGDTVRALCASQLVRDASGAVFFAAREKGRLSDRTLAALEAYSAMDARRRGRSRMRGNG